MATRERKETPVNNGPIPLYKIPQSEILKRYDQYGNYGGRLFCDSIFPLAVRSNCNSYVVPIPRLRMDECIHLMLRKLAEEGRQARVLIITPTLSQSMEILQSVTKILCNGVRDQPRLIQVSTTRNVFQYVQKESYREVELEAAAPPEKKYQFQRFDADVMFIQFLDET